MINWFLYNLIAALWSPQSVLHSLQLGNWGWNVKCCAVDLARLQCHFWLIIDLLQTSIQGTCMPLCKCCQGFFKFVSCRSLFNWLIKIIAAIAIFTVWITENIWRGTSVIVLSRASTIFAIRFYNWCKLDRLHVILFQYTCKIYTQFTFALIFFIGHWQYGLSCVWKLNHLLIS